MPRRPRVHLDSVPLHIVQRGHNREPCFFGEEDYVHIPTTRFAPKYCRKVKTMNQEIQPLFEVDAMKVAVGNTPDPEVAALPKRRQVRVRKQGLQALAGEIDVAVRPAAAPSGLAFLRQGNKAAST